MCIFAAFSYEDRGRAKAVYRQEVAFQRPHFLYLSNYFFIVEVEVYLHVILSFSLLASLSLLYNKGSCDSNSKRTAFAPCSLYAFLICLTRLPALHVDFRSVGNESRMMSYVCPTFLPVPLRNCISWPLSAATLHM